MPEAWQEWLDVAKDNVKRLTRIENKLIDIDAATKEKISWKQFVTVMLVIIAIVFGGMYSMIEAHKEQTHTRAATKEQVNNLKESNVRLERKIDWLIEKQLK